MRAMHAEVNTNTSERPPWARTPAVHSFATQPDLEAYRPLVEGFAPKAHAQADIPAAGLALGGVRSHAWLVLLKA